MTFSFYFCIYRSAYSMIFLVIQILKMQELFTAESVRLKKAEKELSAFLDQTGNLPDSTREWVNGFGRSTAQSAVWANKKGPIRLTTLLNDDTIVDKEAELKNALKLGRLNIKIDEASGWYISTHTIQIKYTNNETHVFPTKDVKINGK